MQSGLNQQFRLSDSAVIALSLGGLGAITLLDWLVGENISLGPFYVLPVMFVATIDSMAWTVSLGLSGAAVRMLLVTTSGPLDTTFRFLLGLIANLAAGFLVLQVVKNRKLMQQHIDEIERERGIREEVERQVRMLVESSPAAILTLDETGRVLNANLAAAGLLGFETPAAAVGEDVTAMLPILNDALLADPKLGLFRASVQTEGRTKSGDLFLAQIWFSTYEAKGKRRLAAIAVDQSDEMREREEESLRQLQASSRIVAAGMAHEVRNVCAAAAMLHGKLQELPGMESSEDFRTLGNLISALQRIAETGLQSSAGKPSGVADLNETLRHLRIVITPAWNEIGGKLRWQVADRLPRVGGDSSGLMQAFLNLAYNSHRAVQAAERRELSVSAAPQNGKIVVTFEDTGPGVSDPRNLFTPFHTGAGSMGLGLYVARSILRSYGGDLRYDPSTGLCRFIVELQSRQ